MNRRRPLWDNHRGNRRRPGRPERVYDAVADFRGMARWSPEFTGACTRGRALSEGTRFVGFNRRGPLPWFTFGRVTKADPSREFALRVTAFDIPTAVWGYRMQPNAAGGTRGTEHWEYLGRANLASRFVELLGPVFSAIPAAARPERNRSGMRVTLARLARHLEERERAVAAELDQVATRLLWKVSPAAVGRVRAPVHMV
ncbi:MAG: SRPBCC family protein [Pseudonocardia sp.]|nr:SRPBCC family protein [Pseudonocardia sp.]